MLTPELQNEIDEKWNDCWPLCQLKPIVILDLVSYLFLIKKISSDQQADKKSNLVSAFTLTGAHGKKEVVAGDFFNDPEDQNIYTLFADTHGTTELEKAYSTQPAYGAFVKGSLLMLPTSKLLETSLGILKIIKNADQNIQGEIFSYLLNKEQYIDANGHAYLPSYLVDLLVAIVQPGKNDVILNPTLGNGNLLVQSSRYVANSNPGQIENYDESLKLKGLNSDITSLRIGAVNLLLNGIVNPELKALDIFAPLDSFGDIDATVILSNLIFLNGEKNDMSDSNARRDAIKKEIYYLDFILKNLKIDARCAVVVPGNMLYHKGSEFINIRKEITENFNFSALISIDDKNSTEFNGASILVFSKENAVFTDKVWFYKLKHNGSADYEDENFLRLTDVIVTHFKNNGKKEDPGAGFYVDANEIRAKDYNFSFNEYHILEKEEPPRRSVVSIKPGGFPKLGHEVIDKSISHLQPASGVSMKNKTETPQPKLSKQKEVVNKKTFNVEKKIAPILLKKIPAKKLIFIAGIFILLFAIGYLFYPVPLSNKKATEQNRTSATRTVGSDSSRLVKASALHSIDSVVHSMNSYLATDSANNHRTSYTVISKAYFYSSPNIGNPEGKYLTNVGGGVLTSIKEENGFVYVNYINSKGRSTKGWLNKNDLEEMGSALVPKIPTEKKKDAVLEKVVKGNSNSSANNTATAYLIKTKAYFYREPNINTRLNLYLNKPNRIKLFPIEDKNGFVYVIYSNSQGKTTHGWLNKNDLEAVGK